MAKPQPERDERQRAIEAFRLANDFVRDLEGGTGCMDLFGLDKERVDKWRLFLYRMVYSFLIITLTKYLEWYVRFKDIIPGEGREECKRLYVKLSEKLQLRKFRNKVVAHIIDNDTGKSLTSEEVNRLFQGLMDKVEEDLEGSMGEKIKGFPMNKFCLWVDSQRVDTIQKARDAIKKRYNLTDEELFPSLPSS